MKISSVKINGLKFIKFQYCCSKNIDNLATVQYYKNSINWDMYGNGFEFNKDGVTEIFKCILGLPKEAFKISKNINWFSISSSGYSFINFNKEYLKDNHGDILIEIINILKNKENYNNRNDIDGVDYLNDINIREEFKEDWDDLLSRYVYWKKKRKENSHYNRFRILERDGFKCKLCGRGPPEIDLHIDHWIPKAKGGLDIYENLITLCSTCNLSKNAQIPKNNIEEVRDN